MNPQIELDKENIQMQIQNYEQLALFISNIHASYAWLFKSFDVMVRTHSILTIGSLTVEKEKNQV